MNIGDKIKELRKQRGVTQEQRADMLILNRQTIWEFDSGHKVGFILTVCN